MPTTAKSEAFYFGSAAQQLFGWMHRPADGSAAHLGLVVCQPFGYEAICGHRGMRRVAESAAAAGIPALRFDYLGTGDSADLASGVDQIEVWTENIVAAVRELQRLTGVGAVLLLGFRLGGSLAMLAAARCREVAGLVLVNPIVNGRRYLRELRAQRLAGSARENELANGVAECLEVGGFSLNSASLLRIGMLDLEHTAPPTLVAGMLVIDPPATPTARAWVTALQASRLATDRTRIEHRLLPGTVEMLMTDPQFAAAPQGMVDALALWLDGARIAVAGVPASGSAAGAAAPISSVVPLSALRLPGPEQLPLSRLIERPVRLGGIVPCFGIVTEPCGVTRRRGAVILLNVGAEYHVGSSRLYVSLARRWARQGYTVLRFDLAGLGDSETRPERVDDEVYPPAAVEDIRASVAFLRTRYGAGEIVLAGLCSGAYHALRAAVADVPVNRLLLVNPLTYYWKDGMTADDMHRSLEVARSLAYYRQRLFSESLWRKLLAGQLSLWRVARVLVQRPLLSLTALCRDWARRLNIRLPHDLGAELEDLTGRGIQVSFVFSRGEPGLDSLVLQCGAALKRLAPRFRLHVIDTADHIFSRKAARTQLEDILSAELAVCPEGVAPAVPPAIAQARKRSQQC